MSEIQQHELLDVNEKAMDGITPTHFVAASGSPSLIQFLLELKPSFQVIAECDLKSKDEVSHYYNTINILVMHDILYKYTCTTST